MGLAFSDEEQQERFEPAAASPARADPSPLVMGMVSMMDIFSIHMSIAYDCHKLSGESRRS